MIPNPILDLAQAERRPALVVAELEGDDRILCQITRRYFRDRYPLGIIDADFEEGSPKKETNVSPTGSSPPTAG